MTVVDEKGRLFGKVNLLDLVIILAVLAVAGRFGYRALNKGPANQAVADKTIEVTFKLGGVSQATIDQLPIGATITENQSAAKPRLGTIVATDKKPSIITVMGPDGKLGQVQAVDQYDYYITVAGPGRDAGDTIFMNNLDMKVGRTYFLVSRLWGGSGVPVNINLNPAKR